MALDLKWLLSADDKASGVFDKVHAAGKAAADGINGAFGAVKSKFDLVSGSFAALGAIAAGGAFKKVIDETIGWTSEAVSLSKALGITTEKASILNVALGDVYLDKDTMLAGAAKITKTLSSNEEAFTKLGVAVRDSNGNYRSTIDIMTDTNTALGKLKAGTDRNVAGMAIYGKSWNELSALMKLNNGVMDEAGEKAKRLGLLVGDEKVAAMKAYKAAMNDIEDVVLSLSLRFGNVLLPHLIKVGAWLGNNGPILADAFNWSLKLLGKTVFTVGDWLGLMAYRAVTLFGIIKSAATGDFGAVKKQWSDMVAAGDDFSKRTKDNWSNWKDDPIKSADLGGDRNNQNEAAKKKMEELVKLFSERAKRIIDIEKDRIKNLLDKEKEYLDGIKNKYTEHVQALNTFKDAMSAVYQSWDARAKAKADAARGPEDELTKRARLTAELAAEEKKLNDSWADPAAKVKGLNDLVDRYRALYTEYKDGEDTIISQIEADRDYQIAEDRIRESIMGVAEEMKAKEAATVSLAQQMIDAEKRIKDYNSQLTEMDRLLKLLPDVKEVSVNLKVNGMNDLASVTKGMGYTSYGDYYTMGGSTYWADGTLADSGMSYVGAYATGTPYVPKTGLALVHQGEAIIPASQNRAGSGNVTFGDVNISLPNVTNQSTARDLARQALPEIERLLRTRFKMA